MNCDLPSTDVVCLYSITTVDLSSGEALLGELKSYFAGKGYRSIVTNSNVTVEDLRAIPKACSVLFIHTHTLYNRDSQNRPFFVGLQTATDANAANIQKYTDELKSGLLFVEHNKLCISLEFIRKYWRFQKASLVFVNGCYSFDQRLRKVTLGPVTDNESTTGCGASVFGGWTAGSIGDLGVRYLFDRLLGSNVLGTTGQGEQLYREDPPQRPFHLESVQKDMANKGLSSGWDPKLKCQSLMQFERSGNGTFGILAPSIESVQIDEKKKNVTLRGFFGTDQSKIRLFVRESLQSTDGSSGFELVRDTSTDAQTIVCKGLPESGAGSAGYLVAAVDYGNGAFVESNPIPITAWKGKFTYSLRLPGQDSGSGIGQIIACVFLRGDIHRSRKEAGEPLSPRPCVIGMVQDEATPAQFASGCCYTDAKTGNSYEWHGSGTLKLGDEGGSGGIAIYAWHRFAADPVHPKLLVNMDTGEGKVLVDVTDKNGKKIVTNLASPINTAYLATALHPPSPFIFDFLAGSLTWEETEKTYAPCYDFPAKTISAGIIYGLISTQQQILTAELAWNALQAKYPPDNETQG